MSKDKEYIVDKDIDPELTEEEREKLREKKTPADPAQAYKRQNVFVDRRDAFAEKDPALPERRRRDRDRRETDK